MNSRFLLLAVWSVLLSPLAVGQDIQFCQGAGVCQGANAKARNFQILQQRGVRPRYSPNGRFIVFDRVNADGYFDVYLADADGQVLRSLTEGRPGIGQRNNGNAVFHPSGNFIVFVSETAQHYLDEFPASGDPGVGLFSNLWATDLNGSKFWQLTDIPIKKSLLDGLPSMATVNPEFSEDGLQLIWTERYGAGGNHNWGSWRLNVAEWASPPALSNPRVLLTPEPGNYITSMGFFDLDNLLVAGNLDGQHEFSMDHYVYSLSSRTKRNIQNTPQAWEEGACISPNREYFVYMSNLTSRVALDFDDPNWAEQPTEREYWLVKRDGSGAERLTFLNDPASPEYLGRRVIVAACRFSPDGRYLAGTLGVDLGTDAEARLVLKMFRIEFADPTMFVGGAPAISQDGVVSAASFEAGLTAMGWTSVFGSNLASSTRSWSESDFVDGRLPTVIDGVSVKINGRPGYVAFVSPTQVNVLGPNDPAVGPVTVELSGPSGFTASVMADKRAYLPAFFRFAPQNGRFAAAVHPDGTFVGPANLFPNVATRPTKPGDIILLFGAGFGATNPPLDPGQLVTLAAPLAEQVEILIGGVRAEVQFAGLVLGGLYQFNVVVPNTPDGDQTVTAKIGGAESAPGATVRIQR